MANRQVTAMLRWNTKPMSMNQKHNRRDRTVTDKEPHIDRNGLCIVLKDEPVKDAYEKLFQVFLDDYNEINRIKNPDRCMDAEQYFDKVVQKYMNNDVKKAKEKATGQKEHGYSSVPWLEYTMYLATPDYDKDPEHKLNMPEDEQIELMQKWLRNFQRRNPNLYVFGAYIHGDEWGTNGVKGQLHMHLCLIPFAHCNRGLKLKVSEFNAYKQMGIENETKSYTDKEGNKKEKVTTLREAWKNKEVAVLDEMLEERGYIPYHPGGRGEAWERKEMHQTHMQMAQEEERKIRDLQQESDKHQNKVNELKDEIANAENYKNEMYQLGDEAFAKAKSLQNSYDAKVEKLNDDYNEKATFLNEKINEKLEKVESLEKEYDDKAILYEKELESKKDMLLQEYEFIKKTVNSYANVDNTQTKYKKSIIEKGCYLVPKSDIEDFNLIHQFAEGVAKKDKYATELLSKAQAAIEAAKQDMADADNMRQEAKSAMYTAKVRKEEARKAKYEIDKLLNEEKEKGSKSGYQECLNEVAKALNMTVDEIKKAIKEKDENDWYDG